MNRSLTKFDEVGTFIPSRNQSDLNNKRNLLKKKQKKKHENKTLENRNRIKWEYINVNILCI